MIGQRRGVARNLVCVYKMLVSMGDYRKYKGRSYVEVCMRGQLFLMRNEWEERRDFFPPPLRSTDPGFGPMCGIVTVTAA